MRRLMQLGIILGVSFAGEILRALIPLPIPASVYGLCLMLLLLVSGAITVSKIKSVSRFLIEVMPVMFIPSCVGLMDVFDQLLPVLIPFLTVCVAGTVLVIGVTGRVTQAVIRRERSHKDA